MNLKLVRKDCQSDGIFGELLNEAGEKLFVTLEHSFECKPKIPDGLYTCRLGKHRLHGMTEDFETFEIVRVPGHTGLLFHWGNFNHDSDGCVLIGADRIGDMITRSRESFSEFMQMLSGVDEFQLKVSSQSVPL